MFSGFPAFMKSVFGVLVSFSDDVIASSIVLW